MSSEKPGSISDSRKRSISGDDDDDNDDDTLRVVSISFPNDNDNNNNDDDYLKKKTKISNESIEYYNKLMKVVDHYKKNLQQIRNHNFHPVTDTMFVDSIPMFGDSINEELNEGDIVYDSVNNQFKIVVGKGNGIARLSEISQYPRELKQNGQLGRDNMNNYYKVNFNTVEKTGGKSRKSKKSRKTRKARKTIKARKSRKM